MLSLNIHKNVMLIFLDCVAIVSERRAFAQSGRESKNSTRQEVVGREVERLDSEKRPRFSLLSSCVIVLK